MDIIFIYMLPRRQKIQMCFVSWQHQRNYLLSIFSKTRKWTGIKPCPKPTHVHVRSQQPLRTATNILIHFLGVYLSILIIVRRQILEKHYTILENTPLTVAPSSASRNGIFAKKIIMTHAWRLHSTSNILNRP